MTVAPVILAWPSANSAARLDAGLPSYPTTYFKVMAFLPLGLLSLFLVPP
jgi:hypothetical protein